jgi:hypothetical protein
MNTRTSLMAILAGASLAASAPAAMAGDRDGWQERPDCHCACACQNETVQLPASFFEDTGGVGPAFIDTGGGGGGGFVFVGAAAGASASAFASASASASAKVSVGFAFHGHQHMPPMKMMPHKGGYGGKW